MSVKGQMSSLGSTSLAEYLKYYGIQKDPIAEVDTNNAELAIMDISNKATDLIFNTILGFKYIEPKPKIVSRETSTNIASLLFVMNTELAPMIKSLMGKGTRKDILNLRTGRFAESAKVTYITKQQDRYLALFSYMPLYKTFEPGNKQGVPVTRAPSLLVTQAIKNIAKQQAISLIDGRMQ